MKSYINCIISTAFITLFFVGKAYSQYGGGTGQISIGSSTYSVLSFDNTNAWNKVFITDRPFNSTYQTGSPFIYNEWKLADIITAENKAEILNVPARIDAKSNVIEINHDGKVKVLHSSNTYSLVFKTSKEIFVSNKVLGITEPEGFFKIIYNEKSSLICHYSTKLIEGTYNPVLDAGIKENKLLVEPTYYMIKNGKLVKLEKNRKKLIRQFNDQPEVVQYIKNQHITPKLEEDLLKLIGFIDKLS